jgi:hypothetical protein
LNRSTPRASLDETELLQKLSNITLAQGDERAQGPRRHLLIAVVEGLKGFPEAFNSATPPEPR